MPRLMLPLLAAVLLALPACGAGERTSGPASRVAPAIGDGPDAIHAARPAADAVAPAIGTELRSVTIDVLGMG